MALKKPLKQISYCYSGSKSRDFWNIVASLKPSEREEVYALGVDLQNLEETVLNKLKKYKLNSVKERD